MRVRATLESTRFAAEGSGMEAVAIGRSVDATAPLRALLARAGAHDLAHSKPHEEGR